MCLFRQCFCLQEYAAAFEREGYDDWDFLMVTSSEVDREITSLMGMKPGHALKYCSYMAAARSAAHAAGQICD